MECFALRPYSLSALFSPLQHPSETDIISDTSPSATSMVEGVWIHLGTYKQVPKSHWFQTKNVVTGCRFLLSSWIRGITSRFKNLRCQVKLPETKIKTFMHISWHNKKVWYGFGKKKSTQLHLLAEHLWTILLLLFFPWDATAITYIWIKSLLQILSLLLAKFSLQTLVRRATMILAISREIFSRFILLWNSWKRSWALWWVLDTYHSPHPAVLNASSGQVHAGVPTVHAQDSFSGINIKSKANKQSEF